MSTKAYSNDLRLRVIEYIKSNDSQKSAASLFSVGKNTVSRWWLRYKIEGSLVSKSRGGRKGKIDLMKLEEFVNLNPDKTLKEIGDKFGVSDCAVHKRLKQLGYMYKKNDFKYLEANKEKKRRILRNTKAIEQSKLVYINESVIESGPMKDRGWVKKKKY